MKLFRLSNLSLLMLFSALLFCSCRGGAASASSAGSGSGGSADVIIISAGEAGRAAKADGSPVQYGYVVKNAYPHNTTSYTQGLYWKDGYMWEGTGQYYQSALLKTDLQTGKILEKVVLPDEYFGEGIAELNGKIYQLTWLEGTAFVYDALSLEKTGSIEYAGQGWGITTDGRYLYMSNGSSEIHVLEADMSHVRTISVKRGRRSVQHLNELEWIEGRIWANVYTTDSIVIIDPQTGVVTGVLDCTGLLPRSEVTPNTDVLNGIAYDPQTGRIFLTGKNWSRLFEVELMEK